MEGPPVQELWKTAQSQSQSVYLARRAASGTAPVDRDGLQEASDDYKALRSLKPIDVLISRLMINGHVG